MALAATDTKGWRLFWSYLMLFTFGWLGVHRFYLGRLFSGIVYACTGGLLGFGVLFDVFFIPYMVATVEE